MENRYHYFKRDISWLSFNYRVLLEAEDTSLPIYERIKFLSIYSSNLEEFYEIRVAEHRAVVMKKRFSDESCAEAEAVLSAITDEVNRQQRAYYRNRRGEPPATGLLSYLLRDDLARAEPPEYLSLPE